MEDIAESIGRVEVARVCLRIAGDVCNLVVLDAIGILDIDVDKLTFHIHSDKVGFRYCCVGSEGRE